MFCLRSWRMPKLSFFLVMTKYYLEKTKTNAMMMTMMIFVLRMINDNYNICSSIKSRYRRILVVPYVPYSNKWYNTCPIRNVLNWFTMELLMHENDLNCYVERVAVVELLTRIAINIDNNYSKYEWTIMTVSCIRLMLLIKNCVELHPNLDGLLVAIGVEDIVDKLFADFFLKISN